MSVNFKIELCGNPDYVQIHTTEILPRFGSMVSESNTEAGKELQNKLEVIPGVEECSCFNKYSMSLEVANLFDRKQVAEQAIEILRKYFEEKEANNVST